MTFERNRSRQVDSKVTEFLMREGKAGSDKTVHAGPARMAQIKEEPKAAEPAKKSTFADRLLSWMRI
jgi:hypothetical protein